MPADFSEKVDVVELGQPFGVVDEAWLYVLRGEKGANLATEVLPVFIDLLHREHLSHIGLAGRVADACRPAPDDDDGIVSGLCEVGHRHDRNHVAHMEAPSGRIEPDVECHRLFLRERLQRLPVRALLHEPALLEDLESVACPAHEPTRL